MDDPIFTSTNTVGGSSMRSKFAAMPDKIHSDQSFILVQKFADPLAAAFDIATAVATLYVAGYNNTLDRVALTSGVLSDSGSGTTDTVTFTVPKDLIPTDLGSLPQRNPGNSVFFYILEDTDSILEFAQEVNVIDPSYNLQGSTDPGSSTITTQRNDLGTVEDTTIVTPPAQTFGLSYVVGPAGATGDWLGQENNLAVSNGSSWIFTLAAEGNFVFNKAIGAQEVYDGAAWDISAGGDMLASAYDPGAVAGDAFDMDNMVEGATTKILTDVERTAIAANTAKVTNATHTGEVTGTTALTLSSTAISNKSLVSATSGMELVVNDGGALKKINADDLLGLTDVAVSGLAQGDVLYYNGGSWINLGAGSNGQFLKTQGVGANPAWETIPGGGDMLAATYDAATISEQLVGLTAVQVLTNKTMNGVVLTAAGSTANFLNEAGNYVTIPGGGDMLISTYDSAAISEQLVGLTATQSLTNKTVNGVVLSAAGAATDFLNEEGNYIAVTGGLPTGRTTGLATTGTVDIDWSLGDTFVMAALTGNVTLTFSGPVVQGQDITLDITGASGFTLTMPASVTTDGIEGTTFTPDVQNFIALKATDAATAQIAIYTTTTAGAIDYDASKNLIIDGQLNHWDEGTSQTGNGYGSSTMFRMVVNGMTTPSWARQGHALGDTDHSYYGRLSSVGVGDTVNNYLHVATRLKLLEKTAGKTVTVRVKLKGSVVGDIGIRINQNFGTGGVPSVVVFTASKVAITTSFAYYDVEFTLSSITGKDLGTNNDSSLELVIEPYLGSTYSLGYSGNPVFTGDLDIDGISLVEGSTAFNGPWNTAEEERERISPYLNIIGNYSDGVAGTNGISLAAETPIETSISRRVTLPFKTMMIGVPAITYGTFTAGTFVAATVTKDSIRIAANGSAAASQVLLAYLIADARL